MEKEITSSKVETSNDKAEVNEKNATVTKDVKVTKGSKIKEKEEEPSCIAKMLKMKVRLADRSQPFLFSYGPRSQGSKLRHLNCHLCRMGIVTPKWKTSHLTSSNHLRNLGRALKVKLRMYKKPYYQYLGRNEEGLMLNFAILPGENIEEITDEYKDRISIEPARSYAKPKQKDFIAIKQEQLHVYNQTMPLLGLAYIFKMRSDKQVIYHCALCETDMEEDAYQHVISSTHQANYIVKHFPKLYAKVKNGLRSIKNANVAERRICDIFRYFYHKIEQSKKKSKVHLVDFENFQQNRDQIVQKCQMGNYHYDENTKEFTPAEVQIIINKALRGEKFIEPDPKLLKIAESGSPALVVKGVVNKVQDGRNEPPQKMRRQEAGPAGYNSPYHLMLDKQLDDINARYKTYETNPQSHPQYGNIWMMFWSKKRGRFHPRDDDPEWEAYWIQHLCNCYNEEVAFCKNNLKRVFNLPCNRSPSPVERRGQQMQQEPMEWQPEVQAPRAPDINQNRQMPIFTEDTAVLSSEPLSVISVMRMLSALEDQLGSLGPTAIELLSKAVLYAKEKGDADELLLDNDCYVFLATVKERFRGQLQAEVIDPSKIKAVTHCINEISAILQIMARAQAKEREMEFKQVNQHQQGQKRGLEQQRAQTNINQNSFGINRNNSFGESGGNFAGRLEIGNNLLVNRNPQQRRRRPGRKGNSNELFNRNKSGQSFNNGNANDYGNIIGGGNNTGYNMGGGFNGNSIAGYNVYDRDFDGNNSNFGGGRRGNFGLGQKNNWI